ncbi:hypothetical protein EMCRGX_G017144 [Ephydatia muelleri]
MVRSKSSSGLVVLRSLNRVGKASTRVIHVVVEEVVRLYEVHPNNDHDCGQQPQVLQILKAADDAGQAVGDVDELEEEVGDMLVQERDDQGSVHHGVEASLGWVLKRTDEDVKLLRVVPGPDCFLIGKITQEFFSSVPRNYGKMYFMPCVLPICPEDDMVSPHADVVLTAAPLHFRFSSKCVPPGFFVRLAAVLSTTPGFRIVFQTPMYSNRVTFQFESNGGNSGIDDVTISETKFSIRVEIARVIYCSHVDGYNFPSICRLILKLLLGAAHELYKWFPFIEIRPEFQCECPKGPSPHFAELSTEAESSTALRCEFRTASAPTAEQQLWMKISPNVDKEGVLYQSEINELLKDLSVEAFVQLSTTLEMDPETIRDKLVALCQWSCKMGSQARSHLVYHLGRIGQHDLARRIDIGYYPKHAEVREQAHVYSVVTDEELVSCARHIDSGADLSLLAAHLGIPTDTATNTPTNALGMLKWWKQQHTTHAYKEKLINIFTSSGSCFEKASRLLSGDGAEKPNMQTVMQSISEECAPKWYDLGLQLDVPDSTLRIIEKDCQNNCKDAIRKMIHEWLHLCSKPT